MRGTILYGAGDVRVEDRDDPKITQPTDAIIRTVAACVCGSDLWPYRGVDRVTEPRPIGHEYVGIVEEVGDQVDKIKPGQFVIGGFYSSDGTCPHCRAGFHYSCDNRSGFDGCQSEYIRIPHADGTLFATPEQPDPAMIPSLLTLSDVMSTGWHAAVAAGVRPGSTVAVVGDGAVGLSAVLAARELGASKIIAMSRHADRQRLARDFGATDIVAERGDDGVKMIMELTGGVGADAVCEAVGTDESMKQSIRSVRPGGVVGCVGVPHGVELPAQEMFFRNVGVKGGPASVPQYLPDLLERVWSGSIEPGKVFDLQLPLEDAAEAYRAMDTREAIKAVLWPAGHTS
ncbi:MAG TPA: zinc-dependent alcohol dehydrogenase family protein [Microlunatus sp.]